MASGDRNENYSRINDVVLESDKDVKEMNENLAKLRALSADDKTEAAMLRSRIDEQSRLIMILKQRADDAILRMGTLDRINKDLMEFRESANGKLALELKKQQMLERRFEELSSNHDEMIKIKDEYKRANAALQAENARLRQENARLFSQALEEKDHEIHKLTEACKSLKKQYAELEKSFRQMQQERRGQEEGLRSQLQETQTVYQREVKDLKHKLAEAEERLRGATYKLSSQMQAREEVSMDHQRQIQSLTKEKDELLDLVMQRGKIITKEQSDNKNLQKKIIEMQEKVKQMEAKFERDAAEVNANKMVMKLKAEVVTSADKYDKLMQEHNAYKKHTQELLQRERELNEKLRHLVG